MSNPRTQRAEQSSHDGIPESPLVIVPQCDVNLMAENQRLRAEVENLREQLREAHAEKEGLHDELVIGGLRQESFGV